MILAQGKHQDRGPLRTLEIARVFHFDEISHYPGSSNRA